MTHGWYEGVSQMTKGEFATGTMTSDVSYDAQGAAGRVIPPNASLVFDVELLDF